MESFTVWLDAEQRAPGQWDPADDLVDAIVTLADGTRWVATFCTFAHLARLRARFAETGDCLGGRYVWFPDLVLAEDTSRATIEAAVADLLAAGTFRRAFDPCPAEDPGAAA